MATVHNPTGYVLDCRPLGRHIDPGETVEVTDEAAAKVSDLVFVVRGVSSTTQRSSVKRGAKVAEVSGAPAVETR